MKKGFTLIELLAVIVVLAIITLIAVPIIANVIENAKRGSALDSAYGYIDALEKNVVLGQVDSRRGILIPSNNELNMLNETDAEVLNKMNVKGEKPTYVEVTFAKGKVKTVGLCMNGFNVKYENKKAVVVNDANYCKWGSVTDLAVTGEGLEYDSNNSDYGNLTISPGIIYEFTINVEGAGDNDFAIESSDTSVVTVSGNKATAVGQGNAVVTVKAGVKFKKIAISVVNDSVLGYLMGSTFDATNDKCSVATDASSREYFDCDLTITANGEEYPAHVYNYDSDLTIAANTTIGSTDDLGAKMVVLKVNGNLTIDSGATLYPVYNNNGGPKGFTVFVTGTLTNNGIIQNTRGGRGNGQDVHLWKNADTTERTEYETVPALGAAGGGTAKAGGGSTVAGKAGGAGSGRGTGGGGGGAGRTYSNTGTGGGGGRGTSYSGGAGGGGGAGTSAQARTGGTGSSTGGAGGAGKWMGGGAGNPGGGGSGAGGNGTGGLLIIYANNLINNSAIKVQGTAGGNATDEKLTGGGGSGGGSINVFYNTVESIGTTTVTGGNGGTGSSGKPGGKGGNGTATFGSIATGTFVPYKA